MLLLIEKKHINSISCCAVTVSYALSSTACCKRGYAPSLTLAAKNSRRPTHQLKSRHQVYFEKHTRCRSRKRQRANPITRSALPPIPVIPSHREGNSSMPHPRIPLRPRPPVSPVPAHWAPRVPIAPTPRPHPTLVPHHFKSHHHPSRPTNGHPFYTSLRCAAAAHTEPTPRRRG